MFTSYKVKQSPSHSNVCSLLGRNRQLLLAYVCVSTVDKLWNDSFVAEIKPVYAYGVLSTGRLQNIFCRNVLQQAGATVLADVMCPHSRVPWCCYFLSRIVARADLQILVSREMLSQIPKL